MIGLGEVTKISSICSNIPAARPLGRSLYETAAMLVIRRAQLRSLEPADWWRPWIRGHLARHFPVQVAALGEDGIGRIIELGEQGARSHGFSAGSHICLFIDLMVLLGEGFDRDPALPWAAAILAERDRDDEDRSCRLADRAARHLDGLG